MFINRIDIVIIAVITALSSLYFVPKARANDVHSEEIVLMEQEADTTTDAVALEVTLPEFVFTAKAL
jgi:uncharacterized protein YpmB